ncbi:MAG: DNA starvation/stationary phase protection protein [Opitutales bacterium]|nr:DNA starvation/stationary phase protection protein [Opitutales bacterium]
MTDTHTATSKKLTEALNLVLADSYALMVNTHNAHWNVEGPGFFALHAAFEEQYTNLFTAIDEIAERIRALGGYAMGSLPEFSETARLDNLQAPMKEGDFVRALLKGNEKTVTDAKMTRDLAADEEDKETEDLMIERITYHEKTIWMLKSFLGG